MAEWWPFCYVTTWNSKQDNL